MLCWLMSVESLYVVIDSDRIQNLKIVLSFLIVLGNCGFWPNTISYGVKPVLALIVLLCANANFWASSLQFL